MSDILADFREWQAEQQEQIGTHSDCCHMWPRHERCMIHRLAAELEKTREAIRRLAEQDATLSVCEGDVTVTMDATFTDAEREAVDTAEASLMRESTDLATPQPVRQRLGAAAATLHALLERLG